ncbi:MAG: Bug family tripartite tricarboxylate transporter substrate binding protein [Pseudomonadota bacterium]
MKITSPIIALAVAGGLAGAAAPAVAQPAAEFYRGKTIDLLIGFSPGGGYDTYGRVLARHLGKHLPGNPKVVAKNMPGAGSLRLANFIYAVAAKDGTVIGTFARGLAMDPLLGGEGIQFDAKKFTWIGSMNNEVSVCASWHTSPVKTWADLLTHELVVGGLGSGADTDTFPLVLRNVLGAKLKLITGYPGGADILLAMERGEVTGRCGWSWSTVKSRSPAWLKEGKVNLLVQMSLNKHPDIPLVPLVMDLARNEEQKQILRIIFARQVMGRPFAAPPGLPADRAAALRRAFDAALQDPELIAEAEKADLELNPVTGEGIAALVEEIYKTPPEIAAKAATASQK